MLRGYLGHRGYVKVPDPWSDLASDERRELVIREFQLALLQHPDPLFWAQTRVELMSAAMDVLRSAAEKVEGDLRDASRYAEVGLTDDERVIGRHVGDFLPHDA